MLSIFTKKKIMMLMIMTLLWEQIHSWFVDKLNFAIMEDWRYLMSKNGDIFRTQLNFYDEVFLR